MSGIYLCGKRHACAPKRRGHRWGRTRGKIGYHGGKVDVVRPRVRCTEEMPLPSWTAATIEDWLGKTAMNLMLIGVATRKIGRAIRLEEPVPRINGDDGSRALARRFNGASLGRSRRRIGNCRHSGAPWSSTTPAMP